MAFLREKTTALAFTHPQNLKLSLFEHMFGYDSRVVLIGSKTSHIMSAMLADIDERLSSTETEFLRDTFPEIYKYFGLENNSDTFLALIYCLLNSSKLATSFADNGLAIYAERPKYPSHYGSSFFGSCANRLLLMDRGRALHTSLCLAELFPLDPLFLALTTKSFFPINWIYMHFTPTASKKKLYEHRQFEFLQTQFFDAHKNMLYDVYKHYAEPYAAHIFESATPQNDFIPLDPHTPIRRYWSFMNPLTLVKDFPTFFAYFLYFTYFYKSSLGELHLVASYGRRLRLAIMGVMAKQNKLAHTICVCMRDAIPNIEQMDAMGIIEEILLPLALWKYDVYDNWTHSLIPVRDGLDMQHSDLVDRVHFEAKTRAKVLSIVNNTLMSITQTTENWQDMSSTFDTQALRFIIMGGSIGRSIIYTTRPALMLIEATYNSIENVLYLTVSIYKNNPIRTRRRGIHIGGTLVEGFKVVLIDANTGSTLHAAFDPAATHITNIVNNVYKEPGTSIAERFGITLENKRLVHAAYFMEWSKSVDRVFLAPEFFWSSGVYLMDVQRIKTNTYLYANTAIQDILQDTIGVLYRAPYYLYTKAPILDQLNMGAKTGYVSSWRVSLATNKSQFSSLDSSINYQFASTDFYTYAMAPRFVKSESKLKTEPTIKFDMEVREHVPVYETDPSIWISGMSMGLNFSIPNSMINVIAPGIKGGYVWYSTHYQPTYTLASTSSGPVLLMLVDVEFFPNDPVRLEQFHIESEHVVYEVSRKYTRQGALNFVIYVYAPYGFQSKTNFATCGFWANNQLIIQVQLKADQQVKIYTDTSGTYYYSTNVWSSTTKIDKIVPTA